MKSGKAKKIIRETDLYISVQGVMFQDSRAMMKKDAIKAVEIAEREAEERMRERAAKAFKFACRDNFGGVCWANDDHHVKCSGKCAKMNDFIQKLNENEND